MVTKEQTDELQRIIDESRCTVFFGGAGVSTESGVPDFRSPDGLYSQKSDIPAEEILSHEYFFSHTADFYRYYRDKLLISGVKPNQAHIKLSELERCGKLSAVITQNIDGLHQAAGSDHVIELHGSVLRNHCVKCGKSAGVDYVRATDGIPYCACGAVIKPDVVLYGESLKSEVLGEAAASLSEADTLIVAGTSLSVYPAAGLIRYFRGRYIVLINRDETSLDGNADLVIHGNVGEVLSQIKA